MDMLRVLRTDIYRLFRSKAFYAYPIILIIVLTINLLFAVNTESPVVETASSDMVEDAVDGFNDGFSVEVEINTDRYPVVTKDTPITISWVDMLESLYDGFTIFIIGIVMVIFYTCETRRGFVKNAAGCIKDRGYMVFSKMIVGIVTIITYIIEFAILSTFYEVLRSLLSGRPLQWVGASEGDVMKIIGFFIICFAVDLSIIAIAILIHEIFNSRALGIVVVFVITSSLMEQLIHGIVDLLRHLFNILQDFDIGKYLLFENISGGYESNAYHPETISIMCLIYIVGCTILAVWVLRKKDIK